VSYRKTGPEWEILADLGLRLRHKEEAKEAYQKCLDQKFSARAWIKLLEMYSDEGDLSRSLNAIIRLSAHQQRYDDICQLPFYSLHELISLLRPLCRRWYAESAVRIACLPRIISYPSKFRLFLLQYPSAIAKHLFKLAQVHGFEKIRNTVSSMGMPAPVTNVVLAYLNYGTTFKVEGSDF